MALFKQRLMKEEEEENYNIDINIFVNILLKKNIYSAFDMLSKLILNNNENPNYVCDIFLYIIEHYDNFSIVFENNDIDFKCYIFDYYKNSNFDDEDSVIPLNHKVTLLECAMNVNNIKLIDIIMDYYVKNNIIHYSIIFDALQTPAFKYMIEKYDILNKYNIYAITEEVITGYEIGSLDLITRALYQDDLYKLHIIYNYIYDNLFGNIEEIDATEFESEIIIILDVIKKIFIISDYKILDSFITNNLTIREILINNKIYIYKILYSIYFSQNYNYNKNFNYLIDNFIIEMNNYDNKRVDIIKRILHDIHDSNNDYQLNTSYENERLANYIILNHDIYLLEIDNSIVDNSYDDYDYWEDYDISYQYIPNISKYIIENILYFKLYLCNHLLLLNKKDRFMQYIDSIYYLKEDMNDKEFIEFLQKLLPVVIHNGTYEDIIKTIEVISSLQIDYEILSEKIKCNYCNNIEFSFKCEYNKNIINRLIGSPNNMCEKISQLCSNMNCIHSYIHSIKTNITLKNMEKTLKEKKGFPIEMRYYISKFIKEITPEEYRQLSYNIK